MYCHPVRGQRTSYRASQSTSIWENHGTPTTTLPGKTRSGGYEDTLSSPPSHPLKNSGSREPGHSLRLPLPGARAGAGLPFSGIRGPGMTPTRGPDGSAGALKKVRELRRRGKASPKDFHLILRALEEASRVQGPVAREVRQSPDLHVAFQLKSGAPLGCVQIRKGRAVSHRDPEPNCATRVVLPAETAAEALANHPARALIDAYMKGAAEVGGEMSGFMTVISLLEGLAAHLAQK